MGASGWEGDTGMGRMSDTGMGWECGDTGVRRGTRDQGDDGTK